MSPDHRRALWGFAGFMLPAAWFADRNGWRPLVLLLSAAGIHEAAHWLALRSLGAPVTGFRLSPFGAAMETQSACLSYPAEAAALLSGPLSNLICGAACALAAKFFSFPAGFAPAGANLILGAFNLLPIRPLDGGRLWQLLLTWLLGPDGGEVGAAAVGAACAGLLSAGLAALILRSGGSLWLLPAVVGLGACSLRDARELWQFRAKPA